MKLCECGCGEPAPIAPRNRAWLGHRKGEPVRFIQGHWNRAQPRRTMITEADYSVEDRGYETPCWIWQRSFGTAGYGQVGANGQLVGAHRFSWTVFVGPIPEGHEIDHLCFVKACIRPSHLEPVTGDENKRRARAAGRHSWINRKGI